MNLQRKTLGVARTALPIEFVLSVIAREIDSQQNVGTAGRKYVKRDVAATEAMQFVEKKSHVCKDGRHILFGLDWKRRVKQLRDRCGGQCEYEMTEYRGSERIMTIRCQREAADPHHIKLRSRGRDDRLTNLMGICRHHHIRVDAEQRKEHHKR